MEQANKYLITIQKNILDNYCLDEKKYFHMPPLKFFDKINPHSLHWIPTIII
jgi:hypothetical protein